MHKSVEGILSAEPTGSEVWSVVADDGSLVNSTQSSTPGRDEPK